MMKRTILLWTLLAAFFWAEAQTSTLKFVGKDRTGNDLVRLDRVYVLNENQHWEEMVFYPDTLLRLKTVVGIAENNSETADFKILQNTPNPFEGVTDFALTLPDAGSVIIEIYDLTGRQVTARSFSELQGGTHYFRATLVSPQTYLLSAKCTKGDHPVATIKMVNAGTGENNSVSYTGTKAPGLLHVLHNGPKGWTSNPFVEGDRFRIIGYASIDDIERVSDTVSRVPVLNSTNLVKLKFDVARPDVTTHAISNISTFSATLNGEVNADNNALVTERGFCYAKGTVPTLNDSTIDCGSGEGVFSFNATSLLGGSKYYVRAYALNAIGLKYGECKSFTTNDTLPTVTTTPAYDIAATTFMSGGNVLYANTSQLVLRGVCWNTTGTPTTADSYTIDGAGLGNFTSQASALEPATTYYVRAYASSNVGTAYGEEDTLTTLCDIPIVVTDTIYSIASRSANGGGNVIDEHGAAVTERGICWNTTGTPTTADAHTTDGTGSGVFSSDMDALIPNTTYYVRAYATNGIGTAYGSEIFFTTLCEIPEVTTTSPDSITPTSFVAGGHVLADNCSYVTRGVCWNTTGTPTTADAHTTDGTGLGNFTSHVTGLNCSTTYYVRAYATNNEGTAYGEEDTLTTLPVTLPSVTTYAATLHKGKDIIVTAEVLSENCETVTERGICYGTSPNPTFSDSHTNNGSGLGTFADTLENLALGTTYYLRAYAINSIDTAYGEEVNIQTCNIPTVTTLAVSNITDTSALVNCDVTADGGATVTARGICWSTLPNPTLADKHSTKPLIVNGSKFANAITGLVGRTTYYVRAFAINVIDTVYGNEIRFTTLLTCNAVTDIDGNTYNTIRIGSQCWMAENLRTTKYADNTTIKQGSISSSDTMPRWYYPGGDSSNKTTYGLLYNWKAVMHNSTSSSIAPSGVQGICPTGWHVPSDLEWTLLTDYVSRIPSYCCIDKSNSKKSIAKALASKTGWIYAEIGSYCEVGYKQLSSNNATGFGAMPAGYYTYYKGGCGSTGANHICSVGYDASYWSATEHTVSCSKRRSFFTTSTDVGCSSSSKVDGLSVRCVRDLDTCATSSYHNIEIKSSEFPYVFGDTTFRVGTTTGTYILIRTNAAGCDSIIIVNLTVWDCGVSTLTDIDGNTYNTVKIGSQCWMAENLRTTRYDDRNFAPWRYPNGSSSNTAEYGYLYEWKTVMWNSSSSNSIPSGVQGICPTGWHVPSDAEWTQLINYVGNRNAKALASQTGWKAYSGEVCAVGYKLSSNNGTSFGAMPAGAFSSSSGAPDGFGSSVYYLSATEYTFDKSVGWALKYDDCMIRKFNCPQTKSFFSVRCVRD